MKQVFFNENGQVVVEEVPAPIAGPGQVLVQVRNSLISTGTETKKMRSGNAHASVREQIQTLSQKAYQASIKSELPEPIQKIARRHARPVNLKPTGYSAAGIIKTLGENINDLRLGQAVACAGEGYAAHAEYIVVPRNLVAPVPEGVPFEEAAWTTIGAIAMQAVRRAAPSLGDSVVVIGLGIIGQLVVQLLRLSGAKVLGVDPIGSRCELAARLGTERVINPSQENLSQAVKTWTEGVGADIVAVCAATESSEPLNQAFELARKKARVVLVGSVGMELDRKDFYRKELDFLISTSYGPGRYDPDYEDFGMDYPIAYVRWTENRNLKYFLELLKTKRVNVADLTSAEFALADAPQAYQRLKQQPEDTLGILLSYPDQTAPGHHTPVLTQKKLDRDELRIGIIGAGKFARKVHIPNIQKIKGCSIRAVVTNHGHAAQKIAANLGAAYASTDYKEVLNDPDMDLVLIATPHHLHAEMAMEAARAKKHIFIEKPLGLNSAECQKISEIVEREGVSLTVGFNRRFAKLAVELRDAVEKLPKPWSILYRVNAPMSKSFSRKKLELEGGRLLGEAVHFVDFICWLLGAEPTNVSGNLQISDRNDFLALSNMSANLSFPEGSVATLVYTTVGGREAGKERIEFYGGNSTLILDDFLTLTGYGAAKISISLPEADKGHLQHLRQFIESLRQGRPFKPDVHDGFLATQLVERAIDDTRSLDNKASKNGAGLES